MNKKTCKGTGSMVKINGRKYCVGEKIVSKWRYSKRNKTTKRKQKSTSHTRRKR